MQREKMYLPAVNVGMNGKIYSEVLDWVVSGKAIRATKYMAKNHIIRATRKSYGGKIIKGNVEITLVIGKPNFAEREFLSKGDFSFPLKGVIVKEYNGKKKKLTKS